MEHALLQLPPATQNRLRSTQILTSLPQIISELLQNSLDAGASQVDIGVDCEEWSCWIRDDGAGITMDSLGILGKNSGGGRYSTSKEYTSDSLGIISTFGFRGEALASAADLSYLEISSRTLKARESWSVILKGGKTLYIGPSIRWRRESPGTVVFIRDAFYNLPIRRLSHPTSAKTLEWIRQEVEVYALVFPGVSFSLENTNSQQGFRKHHTMRIPKTSSSLTSFRHLYGRALVKHVDEINVMLGEMKIEGFISLEGAHSRAYQYLYVNRHPLAVCELHRIIDTLFASSSFTKHALDETGDASLPRSTVRRSPRKLERKPIYVLNLTIPLGGIDNCLEPAKSSIQFQDKDVVSSFFSSIVESFLRRHGFIVRDTLDRARRPKNQGSPLPRKRRKLTSLLSSDDGQPEDLKTAFKFLQGNTSKPSKPVYTTINNANDHVVWKDPHTGQSLVVDSRTGNSYPHGRLLHGIEEEPLEEDKKARARRRTRFRSHYLKGGGDLFQNINHIPEWIQKALETNTVYPLTETEIFSISISSLIPINVQGSGYGSTSSCPHHVGVDSGSFYRFDKINLLNAEIIGQVDRKFIACLMKTDANISKLHNDHDDLAGAEHKTVVLIDQHAADERVRVERFLKEICMGFLRSQDQEDDFAEGVKTKELSPPVPVLITRHEALRLQDSGDIQKIFGNWGFRFMNYPVIEPNLGIRIDEESDNGYVQILVQSVPEVVSDKLLLGDELRELVRGYLAKLEVDMTLCYGMLQGGPESVPPDRLWLKALRWCPRELLELINSKACRGAIMFNDSLTSGQCEKLVFQLSKTAFPFHCAHGRPSLVPLANVGTSRRSIGRWKGPNLSWSKLEQYH